MKKYNTKQKAWAMRQALGYANKMRKNLLLFLAGFIFIIGAAMFVAGDASADDVGKVVIATTIMAAVGDVDDVTNEKRVGKQVKYKLWILSEDQYDDTQAFPSRSGWERGNIPLKNGEYWHYIDAVIDSPEPKWSAEEGDIASTITNELPFILGGLEDSTRKLLETGVGEKFFIVWKICSTNDKFLGGNACKPLKLVSFDGGSTKDNTSTAVVFKNECGEIWSKYVGNTPTQAASTVAADATSIPLISNPQYQLTDGTIAVVNITTFSGTTDADINRIVTILGSGGTYPSTITDVGDFLLIGGDTWTALANKQISFKIFKDGAATYKYVEIAGTRT